MHVSLLKENKMCCLYTFPSLCCVAFTHFHHCVIFYTPLSLLLTQGLPGVDGAKGRDGVPGARGLPGARGEKGSMGVSGFDGEKGEPGQPGLYGRTGTKGKIFLCRGCL